jgi:hypothetical protein
MSAPSQIKFGNEAPKPGNRSLLISIALGVIAGVANLAFVSQVQGTRITVLKAKSRIVAGTLVNDSQFDKVQISGTLGDMKKLVVEAGGLSSYSSIPLATAVEPGMLLLQGNFRNDANEAFRDSIPDGYRGITLPVADDAAGEAHLLKIGNVIDVLDLNGGLIIGSVKIAALGDATLVPGANAQYKTISIVVPASQVPSIFAQVQKTGDKIRVSLAGPSGH